MEKIIKKGSGMIIIFAILIIWAIFSYNENVPVVQTGSGVVSRNKDWLGSKKSG